MKYILHLLIICLLLLLTTTINAQYIIHIAGNDSMGYYGDGISALHASLYAPKAICRDAAGNLYIGDGHLTVNRFVRIRKVDAATGIITTIAGKMSYPPTGDSADVIAATNARLRSVSALCVDKQGNLLIADGARIRKMNLSTGIISNVAGSAIMGGYAGNGGPATAALLNSPYDLAVDKANNIYIADFNSAAIRKVDALTGIITRVAGNDTIGYGGDGGPATAAKIKFVYGICLDSSDNLYIADRVNYRVRKVNALTGIITTIAGTGTSGITGDGGPATDALLALPAIVTIDKQQNLFIFDGSPNFRIRRVDALTGIITFYAGNGTTLVAVDSVGDNGPATAANIYSTGHIFIDTCGTLYMGSGNCRIRAIVPALPTTNKICGYTINAINEAPAYSAAALSIYPNPNYGQFSVSLAYPTSEPVRISITDITGRKIKDLQTTTNKETPLHIDGPPGMYFIQAATESGRWCNNVVVR